MKPVICKFCGERFDREKEECVKIGNRYAHSSCYDKHLEATKDYRMLTDLIKKLYAPIEPNWSLIGRQLQTYKDSGKTWMGMYYTLTYFFIIQKNDIHKGAGVGIIPYVYNKAEAYYRNIDNVHTQTAKIRQAKDLGVEQTESIITITQQKPRKQLIELNY